MTRARALLLASLLVPYACSAEPAEVEAAPAPVSEASAVSARDIVYPLTAFRSEHTDRVTFTKGTWPHHLELNGKTERVIVMKTGASIEYAVSDFAGGRLIGGLAVRGKRHLTRSQDSTFRVELRQGDRVDVLLERTLALGARESFDIPVPHHLAEDARLTLRATVRGSRRIKSLWIDPFLQRIEPSPMNAAAERPNVILITSDTTRQDELGVYGGAAATPTLEALARDGIRFDQAYSVAYGTTPSHSSLMTALHAAKHGVYSNKIVLAPEPETLAEFLGAQGYATAAFVGAAPLARSLGLDQGFDRYEDTFALDADSMLGHYAGHERRAARTVDLFSNWVAERDRGAFFAWLHFFDPHQPYAPPASHYTPKAADESSGIDAESFLVDDEGEPLYLEARKISRTTPAALAPVGVVARARYRAEIEYLDSELGRLVAMLKARGLYDSALIVFIADHGENFDEHRDEMAFEHAGLYRETTQIPFIVKLPANQYAGAVRDDLVANIDVVPTVAKALGTAPREAWQGVDVLSTPPRDHLILEGMGPQEIAVRTPHWLYRAVNEAWVKKPHILRSLGYEKGKPHLLFDLGSDAAETTNVYANDHAAMPGLTKWLEDFAAAQAENTGEAPEVIVDPNHIEALRNLGYVE